jgi:hypothetical protein
VNILANAFSLVSATKGAACVKVIEGNPTAQRGASVRLKVVTLCRDDLSQKREEDTARVDYWIDQNTDFEDLLSRAGTPEGRYFFSNYLPRVRGYRNTSFRI